MRRALLRSIPFLLVSLMFFAGCDTGQNPTEPAVEQDAGTLTLANPVVQRVATVQDAYTSDLMTDENILGTATGVDENGVLVIIVYVNIESQGLSKSIADLPAELDEIPVIYEVTEPFRAMRGKPGGGGGGGGVDHKAKQTPPVKMGTSGGWGDDLANGYCCGGTLGSLVQGGGKQYILSNYHVFAADIVPGGNGTIATIGDFIIQPGLIDVGCNASAAQNVATLSSVNTLPGANVDCAIAEVISGMVASDGEILEVGTLSANTAGASIGQKVKKSGRTTGLTRSSVNGLNATISVTYDNECAGGTAFTKTFTGQIVVKNRGSKFLAGGDSGSLMVEDASSNPRAVGLLYAGSSTTAIANPINDVLNFLGVSMVGN